MKKKKPFNLEIDVLSDQDLQKILTGILSGLLPHENYTPKSFSSILKSVFRIIRLTELKMEYYVIFHILNKFRIAQGESKDFIPRLTEEILETTMEVEAANYAQNPRVGVKEWIQRSLSTDGSHVQTSAELEEELILQENATRLYDRVMDLYSDAMSQKKTGEEALALIPTLLSAVQRNVAIRSLDLQGDILNYGKTIQGDTYIGAEGWLNYIKKVMFALRSRISSSSIKTVTLDSLESLNTLEDEMKRIYDPLCDYRVEPLDQSTPMRRYWLAVFCGNENTGKTADALTAAARLIVAGYKVVYMVGESPIGTIFSRLLSSYIYETEKLQIPSDHLVHLDSLDPEIREAVSRASLKLIDARESGQITFLESLSYTSVYDDLAELYEEIEFDAVFIDHSNALRGNLDLYERIGMLSSALLQFKKDYPVYVHVTSHLSTEAKLALEKGKIPNSSPTKGNGTLSADADLVVIYYAPEDAKQKDLIQAYISKTRGAKPPTFRYVIRLRSAISHTSYNLVDQGKFVGEEIEMQSAIEALESNYSSDFDLDYLSEEEDFDELED